MKRSQTGPEPVPENLDEKKKRRADFRARLAAINLLSLAGLERTFAVDPAGRLKHGPEDPAARKKRRMEAKSRQMINTRRRAARRRAKKHNRGQRHA